MMMIHANRSSEGEIERDGQTDRQTEGGREIKCDRKSTYTRKTNGIHQIVQLTIYKENPFLYVVYA